MGDKMFGAGVLVLCIGLAISTVINPGGSAVRIRWSSGPDVNVRIDQDTGLHYLEGQLGGMTPRLGPDGKQMREKVEQ